MSLLAVVHKSSDASRLQSNGGFSGYGSPFHTLDLQGDIIAPGAFVDDIPRFLKKGFVGGSNHDHKTPIGRFTDAFEDPIGLWVEAALVNTKAAQETRELIQSEVIQSLSIGILPLQARRLTPDEVLEYWKKAGYQPSDQEELMAKSGARLIKRAKILEISPAALPANENAAIVRYKSLETADFSVPDLAEAVTSLKSLVHRLEHAIGNLPETAETPESTREVASPPELPSESQAKLALFEAFLEKQP